MTHLSRVDPFLGFSRIARIGLPGDTSKMFFMVNYVMVLSNSKRWFKRVIKGNAAILRNLRARLLLRVWLKRIARPA